MGSPLSPIVADLVLQDLEKKALEILEIRLPFYYRYVDDIAMAIPQHKVNECLNIFNSLHPRMQFTLENGAKKLNFLNVTIINEGNLLEFDWFQKPTCSGRVLNYLTHHPISQKRGVIMSMVDKAVLLSHPKYQEKNLKYIVNTFLNNNYSLQFIFGTINSRLKSLFNRQTKKQNSDNIKDDCSKGWFLIPFISNVTEKFRHVANSLKRKLAFFSLHKLGRIIKAQKDTLPIVSNKNVMYKLSCKNCNATYVGQTKRKLATRVTEHMKDINKITSNHSVVTNHRIEMKHDFEWDKLQNTR